MRTLGKSHQRVRLCQCGAPCETIIFGPASQPIGIILTHVVSAECCIYHKQQQFGEWDVDDDSDCEECKDCNMEGNAAKS